MLCLLLCVFTHAYLRMLAIEGLCFIQVTIQSTGDKDPMLVEGNLFALSAVHEQLRERDARHNAGSLPTCPTDIFSKHEFLKLPKQPELNKFMGILRVSFQCHHAGNKIVLSEVSNSHLLGSLLYNVRDHGGTVLQSVRSNSYPDLNMSSLADMIRPQRKNNWDL